METRGYSATLFKEALKEIKRLIDKPVKDPYPRLQHICLNAGVKVVYTPSLPQIPVCGSTRWINNTPLIQLSEKHNSYERLLLTFFHEAGHVLLHGKKDIFLEKIDYPDKDIAKEKEADAFAAQWVNQN